MKVDFLPCQDLSRALLVSADHLEQHQEILNNLNVFPVPDGDTGSNMVATFIPAIRSLGKMEVRSCRDIAENVLPSFSHNSRGNSGFILSRFFKGFFSGAEEQQSLCSNHMAEGFSRGLYEVNTSLFNPKAGTMVTIIEAMAQAMEEQPAVSVGRSLKTALAEARKALEETPQMLPLLARAGVIDSGALGFILIFDGLLAGLEKKSPPQEAEEQYRFEPSSLPATKEENQETTRQYCVELIVKKTEGVSTKHLNEYLRKMGNSIALVNDKDMIKLHIHSDYPEQIFEKMEEYGRLDWKKVEDMHQQMNAVSESSELNPQNKVLLFSPGPGFTALFKEMGLEHVISYAETLPSAGEIAEVVQEIDSPHVIILPNNSNIIPSCMEAREKTDKTLSIIPTTNIIEGLVCSYGFSENENLESNITAMKDSMEFAESLFIYRSNGDRVFDGTEIRKGDLFALSKSQLCAVGTPLESVLEESLKSYDLASRGNITFFYKDSSLKMELEPLQEKLHQEFPDLSQECLYGGQHQAEWIIALE